MPFGLQRAPGAFMNLINEVLYNFFIKGNNYLFKWCAYIVIAVLVWKQDYEPHVKLVREVLKTLYQDKLFSKLSKCQFYKSELDFQGYWILAKGLKMDPGKMKAWATLQTLLQVQRCLGFANFYHFFISNFTQVALLLTEILKSKRKGPDGVKSSAHT